MHYLRHMKSVTFTPTRSAGLDRAAHFARSMGRHYANTRNFDFGPDDRSNVSALSPWIRHRLLTEQEVAALALETHDAMAAEKFLQEVCWRTYWKGWMEYRPPVWNAYKNQLTTELKHAGEAYVTAIEGKTGIDCFDAWARELVAHGYLANHSRMWFASIWIFTLKLPWELGADFFLQHLMDGDAASNTLGWRWVAGLHTAGKTYLARPANIAKYTNQRFTPTGLATRADPLDGFANPTISPLPQASNWPDGKVAMLLTEEDLRAETLVPPGAQVCAVAGAASPHLRSPNGVGDIAAAFTRGAMDDGLASAAEAFACETTRLPDDDGFADAAADWARSTGANHIVTGYAPVGWVRPRLDALKARLAGDGITLHYIRRDWDTAFWPHAQKGFFGLKKRMPDVFETLGLSQEASQSVED